MTLIDSRAGVAATMRALIDETGAPIDADVVAARLGPPLEQELAMWVPADQVDPRVDTSSEDYSRTRCSTPTTRAGRAAPRARTAPDRPRGPAPPNWV